MNTNWAKVLLFSLLSFALGVILTLLLSARCGERSGGQCGQQGSCQMSSSCGRGGMEAGSCGAACKGACGASCKGKKACCGKCKSGADDPTKEFVKELEAADFQGDTTTTIEGATVHVKRSGVRTEVSVEKKESEMTHEGH